MIIARASAVIHARHRLVMTTLLSPPLPHPLDELFHLRSIFPGQLEKFLRIERRRFRSEEGFKSPANVRAVPRIKSISAGGNPIIAKSLKHSSWLIVQRLQRHRQLIPSHRDGQMFMHQQPVRAALFPYARVAQLRLHHFAIFGLLVEVHRHGRPCNIAAPRNSQIFSSG
jgi:hypothetical protein